MEGSCNIEDDDDDVKDEDEPCWLVDCGVEGTRCAIVEEKEEGCRQTKDVLFKGTNI